MQIPAVIRVAAGTPTRVCGLTLLNALRFVAEHGCEWRGLPKRFGNWHTIYTRMNRWSKNGVLDTVFETLQREQIVRIRIESVSLDSTTVKVHPDGTGALKKRTASDRKVSWRMDHQDSPGCRICSNGHHLPKRKSRSFAALRMTARDPCPEPRDHFVWPASIPLSARPSCAAARRAVKTRNGEHET